MSEIPSSASGDQSDLPSDEAPTITLPDDLPPVEPPSAGMIIQLFLVPAVIVVVIVGVYALFGQLASQELDWRQLVTDVKSENPHVRWRGALGLAQMLDADAMRGEKSQHLAANSDIATALADLFGEYVDLHDLSEEELKNLEFLSIALGRMNVQDDIVPIFRRGIGEKRDRAVRKHSLIGLSMLAGNVRLAGREIDQPELIDELIDISKESDQLFRHQGAYALGLFWSEKSHARLVALVDDPDLMTRVNAAVGLARNDSAEGVDIFFDLLKEGAEDWKLNPTTVTTQEEESEYFERMLMLVNSMKAIDTLKAQLDSSQKQRLVKLLNQLLKSTKDIPLKSQILELRESL